MQRKVDYRKQHASNTSILRAMMKHLFLVAFSFLFFLQQIHALSFFSNTENFQKKSSTLLQSVHANETYISLLPPHDSDLAAIEMEVEEDDRQEDEQSSHSNLSKKYASEGLVYNCILRSRYLQLVFSVYHQPVVPFIILHHSWKSYIA
jgi:hypothetical protein